MPDILKVKLNDLFDKTGTLYVSKDWIDKIKLNNVLVLVKHYLDVEDYLLKKIVNFYFWKNLIKWLKNLDNNINVLSLSNKRVIMFIFWAVVPDKKEKGVQYWLYENKDSLDMKEVKDNLVILKNYLSS